MQRIRVLAIVLIFAFVCPVIANAVDISATGACVIDAQSGEIYYEKNGETPLTPASLTKIMTLFVVFEEMEKGNLTESTMIPISQNAARLSVQSGTTNIPLAAGTSMELRTLIDAMVIVSACASCTAVAEYISGSEAEFAKLMNTVAAQYDLNAYFTDSSGLSNDNLITPRSMARLVKLFIEKHPKILTYTAKTSGYINGKKYSSTNKLLKLEKKNYFYEGVDGFKTGTTKKAGSCLVSTAKKNEVRIISVVMHAESDYYRYSDSQKLLDDGFYRAETIGGNILSTDMRAFINGNEIPCFIGAGRKSKLCVKTGDLDLYGFDVTYDTSKGTVYIKENPQENPSPIYEEKVGAGLPLHKTFKKTGLKAVVVKNGKEFPLETVISLNGEYVVSIDEIGALFSKQWDASSRCLYVVTQ